MRLLALMTLMILISACSTPRIESRAEKQVFGSTMSDDEYRDILEKNTKVARGYSGLHNVFNFRVVMMTDEVIRAVARRKALYYQWSEEQLRTYLEDELQKTASHTRFFLSFYTPTRQHDDLNSSSSMWRIYLSTKGLRYTGKATKTGGPVAQIASIFPFHDQWSSAYDVEFLVSSSEVKLSEALFTLAE